ncbi:MAG: hypothetical protein NTZ31_05005 [Actinobacteria bacterium]|jgi:hypothetical protein|nr:hypothetical protein [Actinomycetota bacterium]
MKTKISYALVAVGIILGITGSVRSGAVLIAIGTSVIAWTNFSLEGKRRKIEIFLPVAVALLLFVVALTLPHAK